MDRMVTVVENLVYAKHLCSEHGFALWIETGATRLLFDTGQSDLLIRNARRLGIDLATAEHCVISHGHYDHTGGLEAFAACNAHAPLWLGPGALDQRLNATGEAIGTAALPPPLQARVRTPAGPGPQEIAPGVFIFAAAATRYPKDTHTAGFFRRPVGESADASDPIADQFLDEQTLVMLRGEAVQVVSGCSHRGISNIVQAVVDYFGRPVDLVAGGFHLSHADSAQVSDVAQALNALPIRRVAVSHCTGVEQFAQLRTQLTAEVLYNRVGGVVVL